LSPNLTVTDLWITLIGFTLVYGALSVANFYLLWKFATKSQGGDDLLPLPKPPDQDEGAVGCGLLVSEFRGFNVKRDA
jgi:hypothetical protein